MTDLNQLYGTVTGYVNPGTLGSPAENPERSNDGNATTFSTLPAGGSGDPGWPEHGWETDLGAARSVAAFVCKMQSDFGPEFHTVLNNTYSTADGYGSRIQYWNGSSWADIAGSFTSVVGSATWTYTFTSLVVAQKFRLEYGGKQTNNLWGGIALFFWETTEGAPPDDVVCDFVGVPVSGSDPLEVVFTDLSTGDPDSWLWDFGDGGTSTLQNPTHTYTAPGNYTVSLTASKDEAGPPPPGDPVDPGATVVGLSMGPWNAAAEAATCVEYVSVATPNGGGEAAHIANYIAAGLGVIEVRVGPYGAGVQSINAATWAAAAVAAFNAHPEMIAMEILNEPGGEWFWGSNAMLQANATAYAALLSAVRDAFTTNGSAPLLLASYDGGHPGGTTWATRMVTGDAAVWSYVDGVTVHPYGGTGDPGDSALGNRDAVTEANSTSGLPVWITEVGWPTAVGQSSTGDSLQWSEAAQADNLYNLVTWAIGEAYVAGIIYFMYQDYGTNAWYGVTRIGGAHKKSFEDLRRAAHGLTQS